MRANIELDEKLLEEAMAATGLPTRRATVEEALRSLVRRHRQKAAIGNLILLEVLQVARDERHADAIEQNLRQFRIEPMLSAVLVVQAARNFRLMRGRGARVRKTIDLIIGTFCVLHGHALPHADRIFEPMVDHLGLRVV